MERLSWYLLEILSKKERVEVYLVHTPKGTTESRISLLPLVQLGVKLFT